MRRLPDSPRGADHCSAFAGYVARRVTARWIGRSYSEMRRRLWLYWETPKSASGVPDYIALCRKSVELHVQNEDVVVVTPENVHRYLPDISARIFQIEAKPKSRLDRYLNRAARKERAIAQRADFIRAFLLEKHGGLYIDSDTLLLADPAPYFDLLDSYDFVAARRSSHGKSHVSVNFYGSRLEGLVISEYTRLLRERLSGSLYYTWNEVGSELLTPIVERYRSVTLDIPEREIQPVTWEEADRVLVDTSLSLKDVAGPEARVFMLFNGPFKGPLKGVGMDELYWSDMLISKAFRAAIPEAAYRELSAARSVRSRLRWHVVLPS